MVSSDKSQLIGIGTREIALVYKIYEKKLANFFKFLI